MVMPVFPWECPTTQPIAIPNIIPKHLHAITRLSFFFIDFPFPLYLIPCLRSGYISAFPAAVRSAGDTPLLPVLILPIIPASSQERKDHACPCPLIHSRNGIIFVLSFPPNFSVPASANPVNNAMSWSRKLICRPLSFSLWIILPPGAFAAKNRKNNATAETWFCSLERIPSLCLTLDIVVILCNNRCATHVTQ